MVPFHMKHPPDMLMETLIFRSDGLVDPLEEYDDFIYFNQDS